MPEPLAGEDAVSLLKQAIALTTEAIGRIREYEEGTAPEGAPGEIIQLSRKLNEAAQALADRELDLDAYRSARAEGVRHGRALERAEQAARDEKLRAAKGTGRHLSAVKNSA